MVVWVPDWPVHCLVVDLQPGGAGAYTPNVSRSPAAQLGAPESGAA